MSLAKARTKAMSWLVTIAEEGKDPGETIKEQRYAALVAKQRDATGLIE